MTSAKQMAPATTQNVVAQFLKERWSNMTTLTNIGLALNISAGLENKIIHDFNNGGVTSTYGLNFAQRKVLIKYLLTQAPKCACVNCL